MSDAGDALERLPDDARARLDGFARALERVHVDDLPGHVAWPREPGHRQAVERAAVVARAAGLEDVVDAARRALSEAILREYAGAQIRVSVFGLNSPASTGEDSVRVLRSLGDAVTAIVLGDRLDAADQGELLGLWDRLLP